MALGAAVLVLQAWRVPLDVPYSYTGDSFLNGMAIKGALDHGWVLHNPGVGAPLGQRLHDFPFWDNLSIASMKVLGLAFAEWATVVNVFFLLTFPTVAIAAWLSFRRLGSSRPTATLVAVLYALAPYHFLRGEYHVFLTSYAAVPMACALVVDVVAGRRLLGSSWRTGRTCFTVATVVLVSASVQYYPVFAVILLVVAAVVRFAATLEWRDLGRGAVAAIVVAVLFLLNLAPNIVFRLQHGTNDSVGQRGLHETMAFSLRMIDLYLPLADHRIDALGEKVQKATPLLGGPMEGGSPSLGFVACVGFTLLLGAALVALLRRRDRPSELSHYAVVTVAAFLIATTGGGAAVFAFVVGSPLRAWNRLSIFIAFFALGAVGWCIDELRRRVANDERRWLVAAGMVVVGLVGAFDQTSPAFAVTRSHAAVEATWNSDRDFVAAIERELPRGAAVLQVPYLSFPENGPFRGMLDYEPLRGFLHGDRLRFSYGAVRDRPEDWQPGLRSAPAPVAAVAAAAAGAEGIWIDRRGYPATADEVEGSLAQVTRSQVRRSADGAFSFVSLVGLRARVSDALADGVLQPVSVTFGPGFHPREIDARHLWNWAAGPADMVVDNPLPRPREVMLRALVDSLHPSPFPLTITSGGNVRTQLRVGPAQTAAELRITVPPGRSTIHVEADVPAATSPEGRTVVFRLTDVSLVDAAVYDAVADLGLGFLGVAPVV